MSSPRITTENRRLAGVLFVVGILYFWQLTQPYVFRSPDEAVNELFITRLADAQPLRISYPLTKSEQEFFVPRSVGISEDQLQPGSFLGFILILGTLKGLFGESGLIAFQLAAFIGALYCTYRIVRRYWEPPWALVSVLLVATHPVIVQFVTLPLFHAGMLLAGLCLTALTLLRYQEVPSWRRAIWVGVAVGVTLFVRPSEVIWIGPAVVVILLARSKSLAHLLIIGGLVLLAQVPWMIMSHQVFGSFLATGYTPGGITTGLSQSPSRWRAIFSLVTPAGAIWNWAFLRHVWDYAIALFPVYSLATAISLVWYFRRKFVHWTKVLKIGLMVGLLMYLLAYYGTWELYPGALPSAFGAWNSYDRYWLPLFVGTVAGVIVFFRGVLRWSFRKSFPFLVLIILANVSVVWMHPVAGLRARNERSLVERQLKTSVLEHIPANSMVFAHGPDQIFAADITTSFYLPSSPESWQAVVGIVQRIPAYFLFDAKGKSVARWNAEAQPYKLRVERVGTYNGYILAHVTN